ncbi:lipoprotein-releasing ABC transporter permease subunit [soil metagenome]|nr:ABC transporter permease [Gemmatimonadota bacterium]MDQ3605946.1 ABC transporter permease [Gemmatimonadota bacterium]
MKLEWYIARRYLSSRRGARFLSLITLIAIGGVLVGVMALIVVTSVMSGLQRDLRDKILGTNPHIWLTTYGEAMRMEEWPAVLERVRGVAGVQSAAPFIHTEVGMRNPAGHAEFAILRGIDPQSEGEPITDIVRQIREGRFRLGETQSGYPPLLVGRALADRFGLFPGDVVDIISLQGVQVSPLGSLVPKMRKFEVAGRFETGMYEYDNKFMYTGLAEAQELTEMGVAVTGLEIRVPDAMQADVVAGRIEDELGYYPYRAEDWKVMNSSLFSALRLEKLAMEIILLLIVVVAAFNIISTLVMVVTDKTREIGILKSMGLTSRQVLRIFMLQGVVIGVVGATLGALGGLFLIWLLDRYKLISIPGDVYFIDHLPVALDLVDIGIILGLSVLISFFATLYPARQAASLLPVEAIRHE